MLYNILKIIVDLYIKIAAENQPPKTNLKKEGFNYGDRLYKKGIKTREEREKEANRIKKERELEEQRKYTFKPEIDSNSKLIAKDISKDKPEDRLITLAHATREKKEQQKT